MGQAAMVGKDAPAVRVQDFVKRYRKQTAVDGASLSIERGEIYGLIGPDVRRRRYSTAWHHNAANTGASNAANTVPELPAPAMPIALP